MVTANGNSSNSTVLDWSDVMANHFPETQYRQVFRQAVQDVAAKAQDVLADSHGRIDQAVKLVLAGDVKLLEDGTAQVASQSNGSVQYFVVNGECSCKDYPKAPANFCKHRLAFGICKRATTLTQERLGQEVSTAHQPEEASEPAAAALAPVLQAVATPLHHEAPASANVYVQIAGHKVQVTLRDTDEQRVLARLTSLLAQFPAVTMEPAAPAPAAPVAVAQPACRFHGAENMRPSRYGENKFYCSTRLSDNSLCGQSWPPSKKR
jgi:hypothetical protein